MLSGKVNHRNEELAEHGQLNFACLRQLRLHFMASLTFRVRGNFLMALLTLVFDGRF